MIYDVFALQNHNKGLLVPDIQIVSRENHANKHWLRSSNYLFAAKDTICPLIVQELPKAAMHLPIAFVPNKEEFTLVALLGLDQGQNLLLSAQGLWQGSYLPMQYRSYPFLLANSGDNEQILCIDAASGLITEKPEGEAFFNEDGTPASTVASIFAFMQKVASGRQITAHVCSLLQKHNLIQPWDIKVQKESGVQTIAGLYRIDEDAFNGLSGEALTDLRNGGALPAIFCQLLSMQHLPVLARLLESHIKAESAAAPKELDLEFLNDDGNISFSNF